MILTEELIRNGMASGVGINKKQEKILGIDATKSGWLKTLIGKDIDEKTYNAFVLLKGRSTKDNPKVFSINQVAEQLGVSYDVIKNAIKRCYPEAIKNGKKTEITPGMVTVILENIKNNKRTMEKLTFETESKVMKTTTELTPALKIKKAMELMQEGYEEELANLRAQNKELQSFKDDTEVKLLNGDLVETPTENQRNYLNQNIQRLGTCIGSYAYAYTEFYRRIERDMKIFVKQRAKKLSIKPIDYICSLPVETFNQIFAISEKLLREHNAEPIYR